MSAFTRLLRARASVARRLNEELVREHGLTIEDYEILIRLARAPDMRMRRVDLAEEPSITAANVTRHLDGLERKGLVERDSGAEGGGVVYARLTSAGRAKVREATASHFEQVEELFGSLFDQAESLGALLYRLGEGEAPIR